MSGTVRTAVIGTVRTAVSVVDWRQEVVYTPVGKRVEYMAN